MAKNFFKKIISEPAEILEKGVVITERVERRLSEKKIVQKAEEYFHALGPGLVTGAADDDPSGIATYSQTGAAHGFQFLWLSGATFPLMAFVQEMCARIGLVTGRGLAANIRMHFPKTLLYVATFFLVVANTFNIAADLGAMAEATKLILPGASFTFVVIIFAVTSLALQIFTTYASYARYLKYLTFVLFSYVLVAFCVSMDWSAVLTAVTHPTLGFSKEHILLLCAILGTTISPYLFFWQSSQEVEEEILHGKTTITLRREDITPTAIQDMRIDVWSGMFVSNLVMFFIIAACAATLYQQGITTISTAAEAAKALQPLAGNFAFSLFAVGIIGTGMLAVPVLAGSSSYAVSESFKWKEGLYRKLKDAYAFYGVIIIGMIVGIVLNFVGIPPMKMLLYAAILNGLVAPLILALIVRIASNKKIMGVWVNSRLVTMIGWCTTGIMVLVAAVTFFLLFS
jgi:NRAMP (natural resistance-associated macrophage protein)-like metal ion transporter